MLLEMTEEQRRIFKQCYTQLYNQNFCFPIKEIGAYRVMMDKISENLISDALSAKSLSVENIIFHMIRLDLIPIPQKKVFKLIALKTGDQLLILGIVNDQFFLSHIDENTIIINTEQKEAILKIETGGIISSIT